MNKLQVYNLFKQKKDLDEGILLTFEGIDGSGKNTQVNNIAKYLKSEGFKVKVIGFPQYEQPIGKVISSYLRGDFGGIEEVSSELVCIAYAADRVQLRDEINSYLNNGYIVLSDRYTYSNLFSVAKMEDDKQIDFIKWIEEIEFNQMKVVKPYHNFFLYVDPSVSAKRIDERGKREYQEGKEDIFESNIAYLGKVVEVYQKWAEHASDRRVNGWTIVNQMRNDSQMPIDEVFELLKTEVNVVLDDLIKI